MMRFVLKRVLFFLPTWFFVSVIVFNLSQCVPGDPVEAQLQSESDANQSNRIDNALYAQTAQRLGLDKPSFYFTLTTAAFPDTLRKFVRRDRREALSDLIKKYGNWALIERYYNAVLNFNEKIGRNTVMQSLMARNALKGEALQSDAAQLLIQSDDDRILGHIENLKNAPLTDTALLNSVRNIAENYTLLKQNPQTAGLFLPKIRWHGFNNQYHAWLTKVLGGDFGISTRDGQPITQKLRRPLSITLIMSGLALTLALVLGVSLAFYGVYFRHHRRSKWLTTVLLALYSVPTFWIATLAVMFLTTPTYQMKLFPSIGLADTLSKSIDFEWFMANSTRLILPILCMTLHPTTVVARHMTSAMMEIIPLDYVRTARAKGLNSVKILRGHVWRNALFPLITLLGAMVPSLVAGSFIVELIFNISGMGRVAFDALFERDFGVVYAVIMFGTLLTLTGNLLSDVLYRVANPQLNA